MNRRGFLGLAGAAVVGSQLLDDVMCFAAESVPPAGPSAGSFVTVDVVPVWPKKYPKTGAMDWGFGTETCEFQWKLYKEILEKTAKEIDVGLRFREPFRRKSG